MVGHMDTVFPKGTVAKRPFTMDEKKAYGPGVDDMKSGLLNMYYVVKELVKENTKLHLCLALNCDEEISSRYSNPWISELGKTCEMPTGNLTRQEKTVRLSVTEKVLPDMSLILREFMPMQA